MKGKVSSLLQAIQAFEVMWEPLEEGAGELTVGKPFQVHLVRGQDKYTKDEGNKEA